jgi:hypothetical protein
VQQLQWRCLLIALLQWRSRGGVRGAHGASDRRMCDVRRRDSRNLCRASDDIWGSGDDYFPTDVHKPSSLDDGSFYYVSLDECAELEFSSIGQSNAGHICTTVDLPTKLCPARHDVAVSGSADSRRRFQAKFQYERPSAF